MFIWTSYVRFQFLTVGEVLVATVNIVHNVLVIRKQEMITLPLLLSPSAHWILSHHPYSGWVSNLSENSLTDMPEWDSQTLKLTLKIDDLCEFWRLILSLYETMGQRMTRENTEFICW